MGVCRGKWSLGVMGCVCRCSWGEVSYVLGPWAGWLLFKVRVATVDLV